jgi:hypothetical protein
VANLTAFDLLDACREPDCPVCRLEQKTVERYLDNQFYENVNSPDLREWLRNSLGFCHEHAWLAIDKRLGDALGFAIIYNDILLTTLKRLDEDTPTAALGRWARMLNGVPEQISALVQKALYVFTPRKHCPACHQRDEMTKIFISTLVDELGKDEMAEALRASDGLCLPHLKQALQKVKSAQSYETLLSIHRQKLESLQAELAEFLRKNDYRFMSEGFGREGNSWLRAVAMMIGSRRK